MHKEHKRTCNRPQRKGGHDTWHPLTWNVQATTVIVNMKPYSPPELTGDLLFTRAVPSYPNPHAFIARAPLCDSCPSQGTLTLSKEQKE